MSDVNLSQRFVQSHVDAGRGDRVALITDQGPCSFATLAAMVNRFGNVLLECGVRRGDRVLLALSDSPEFVALWFAAQRIGAVTAEVYTFLQPKDYAYYVDYTQAALVAVDSVTVEPMRNALDIADHAPLVLCNQVAGQRNGEVDLASRAERAPAELEAVASTPDDVAIWKFTTGSTGSPKACVHPLRSPLHSFTAYGLGILGLQQDDVVLPVPKLFFGYARDLAALFPLGVGGAGIVFAERATAPRIFDLIERHRPTVLVNVPTMMQAMLDDPTARRRDLSSLRLATSAGEALPAALHRRWLDTFGVEVLDGIGSSEAYHIYISNRPGLVRIGSMGMCVPGYDATVVDDSGNPVADGETGRLWIRGDSAALMYWGDEGLSAATFGDRLVRSGDLVSRSADGHFHFHGRVDDMLKVGGIWVAPAEIERCLLDHPDVVECAVVGLERDGLALSCAFIVIAPGTTQDADALRDHVRRHLSPHKVPREVRFSDRLPRTGSGKIDRAALRAAQPVA